MYQFRQSNIVWFRLGILSESDPWTSTKRMGDERVAHVSREMHSGLVALHGSDARFTSIEQEQAAFRALCRDVDLLVVLPTGGGKSLLFELPPISEANRITAVILPLIVLLLQFGRKIQAPPHGLRIQT